MGRGKKIVDIDLVIEEAIALIEEGGVEEFSTRRLAARLGISAMTLYNYYENRNAILKGALSKGLTLMWSGLDAEVEAWRSGGGSSIGSYRILAEHLLAFAQTRPSLCRFVLTESAGNSWSAFGSQLEKICGIGSSGDELSRDVYLFELLTFALALKVISGGESAEGFKTLVEEGYDRLLSRHEVLAAAS